MWLKLRNKNISKPIVLIIHYKKRFIRIKIYVFISIYCVIYPKTSVTSKTVQKFSNQWINESHPKGIQNTSLP